MEENRRPCLGRYRTTLGAAEKPARADDVLLPNELLYPALVARAPRFSSGLAWRG